MTRGTDLGLELAERLVRDMEAAANRYQEQTAKVARYFVEQAQRVADFLAVEVEELTRRTEGVLPEGPPRKEALSLRELAAEIGGSKVFWRREVLAGHLPHIRLGRKIVVPRADLDRYLAAHTFRGEEPRKRGKP